MKLLRISPSTDADKKWMAVFELDNGHTKTTHFGARGYQDFTQHKNLLRRQNYLARHRYREDWNDPTSAGALSRWILWERPSFQAAVNAFRERFHL